MRKWKWQVTDRINWDRAMLAYKKGYTSEPEPYHIYAEGITEGTRQQAIARAKLDVGSYKQIIRIFRVVNSRG